MGEFALGQAVPRTEDPRLLTGHGRYQDDFNLPRQAHAVVLRSPHAHAEIKSIDKTATNPLGVKGAGECGAVGALSATMNAINDALAPLGVRHLEMPATAEKIWRAVREAKA